MTFIEYMDTLPHNVRSEKIREVAEKTYVAVSSVYRWMSGSTVPDPLKQKTISEIVGVPVRELWPAATA